MGRQGVKELQCCGRGVNGRMASLDTTALRRWNIRMMCLTPERPSKPAATEARLR